MKKSLLNIAMALCIGLFAACSQEEIISPSNGEVETVIIDAQLPQTVGTRALPGAAEGHQLRCILEVWDKADNGVRLHRIEKLVTPEDNTAGKLQFSFSVGKDVTYQCLLWADFIAADAAGTSGDDGNTQYANKYFNTANLKAIDFAVGDATLFNNASADAFCAAVDKNGTTSQLSVTLTRPFTKVTLTDKTEYINDCENFSVEYETPSGYNIATKTTTATKTVKATNLTPTQDSKTWFSTFIFASADKEKLDQDITMKIKKKGVDTPEIKTIKGGQITLDPNKENNAEAIFSNEQDVTIDVDIDGEYPDPNALKIGQFVNKDGTVSDTYNAETAIGIIFASGMKGDDAVANYDAKFADKKIAGYAMGLTSTAVKFPQTSSAPEPAFPTEDNISILTDAALTSYSGMRLTNAILTYLKTKTYTSELFNTEFTDWKGKNVFTGENSLSDWYIPSYQQLVTFIGYVHGAPANPAETDPAFPSNIQANEAFKAAVTTANAGTFATGKKNTLSSSFTNGTIIPGVQIDAANTSSPFAKTVNAKTSVNAHIRPVLTIFK